MNQYRELLIGCGYSREKRIHPYKDPSRAYVSPYWRDLTTLDNNPECRPDVLCDLCDFNSHTYDTITGIYRRSFVNAFPEGNTFDEIHAYEVLEHAGAAGDYKLLFAQFTEFWRMLKPRGYFCATVPHWKSIWAWGDPGHMRVISAATLVFLDQDEYKIQIGKTAMSDYRALLGETNFKRVSQRQVGELFEFVLRAEK